MKFIGTISNPEDVITKQWITENILNLIPTGSITLDKLDNTVLANQVVSVTLTNPALVQSDGILMWNIQPEETGIYHGDISVTVYDMKTLQICAVTVTVASTGGIAIGLDDNEYNRQYGAGDLKAVIVGRGQNVVSLATQNTETGVVTIM